VKQSLPTWLGGRSKTLPKPPSLPQDGLPQRRERGGDRGSKARSDRGPAPGVGPGGGVGASVQAAVAGGQGVAAGILDGAWEALRQTPVGLR
jgi:hypothetical protein